MRRLIVTCLVALACARTGNAADSAVVDKAIKSAKEWVYSQQKNGTWEESPVAEKDNDAARWGQEITGGQWGGQTALATYALLAGGESPGDEKLKPAIEFLKKAQVTGVYAVAMRAQVWLHLPKSAETKALLKKDTDLLVKSVKTDPKTKGLYGYTPTEKAVSMSRTQYGVLGVWAGELGGIEIPLPYWKAVEEGWIREQEADGGWKYKEGTQPGAGGEYPVTPHMTAAGVASLYITQDYTMAARATACNGNLTNPAIEKGMKWLVDHFDKVATDDRFPRAYPYSTLYAIERTGVASGQKYFGGVDWYAKGSNFLVENQRRDGSWSAGQFPGQFADTCNGILFLARGRAPILINKLNYATKAAPDVAWNQRPRDIANVVRWVADNTERDLAWQGVTLDAPVADLAEAPVLYMSGKDAVEIGEEGKAKIKAVIESGSLLLAHADCGKPAFVTSVRKLVGEMYPQYEFRELPADHVVYSIFPRSKWKSKPSVLGMTNGVREIALIIPTADPAKAWQMRTVTGKEELYQLGADIMLYAANKETLRYRGDTFYVTPDKDIAPTKTIDIARVKFAGNWNPEPGAWRRLAAIFHNERKIDLKVAESETDFGPAKFAHLTGTGKFAMKAPQIDALKKFVDGGGTLLIEAAGGDQEFATSAEELVTKIVPSGKLTPIPVEAPLFKNHGIDKVAYRTYAKLHGVGASAVPRLNAVMVKDRPAVILSRDDLSAGLLGPEMDGVIGYAPESAVKVMSAIVLQAAGE